MDFMVYLNAEHRNALYVKCNVKYYCWSWSMWNVESVLKKFKNRYTECPPKKHPRFNLNLKSLECFFMGQPVELNNCILNFILQNFLVGEDEVRYICLMCWLLSDTWSSEQLFAGSRPEQRALQWIAMIRFPHPLTTLIILRITILEISNTRDRHKQKTFLQDPQTENWFNYCDCETRK